MSAQQRRELLLDAAARVMARGGVAAGTTRAIVAEAGMHVSVFHYCFRSRDEMLGELIGRLATIERSAVWQALEPGEDLRGCLRNAAAGYLAHLEARPGDELLLLELNHYALRTPELTDLAREQYDGYYRTAGEVLEHLTTLTGCSWSVPMGVLTRMVITLLDGITTTWLADRDTGAARDVLDRMVDLLATLGQPA
jgi:AcrR family transcriptional regulator